MNTKPQLLKGFRDFLPETKRQRDFLLEKIKETFELFGFDPLETPTLEYSSLLLGKYGKEADKLIYLFKDRGEREVALRYDQTVPTARVLSQYQNTLPKFFRRYQIQNVFRAEKPQKGRYRELIQCDVDIFGSLSTLADAEILAVTYFSLKNAGFEKIKLLLNDRQTLIASLQTYANEKITVFSIIQSVDKLLKIGSENVVAELIKKGLEKEKSEELIDKIQKLKPSNNLLEIIKRAKKLGVDEKSLIFTPTLARGLDYYTGMIFEIIIPDYSPTLSCGGGGRYDKLIKKLGGPDIPAVGVALGFDRLVEAAEFLNILPAKTKGAQVLITVFDKTDLEKSLEIANILRQKGIKTELFPAEVKIDKQLKYADQKGVPYVVIIGPQEAEKNLVKLKDMKTGEQKELNKQELLNFFNNIGY